MNYDITFVSYYDNNLNRRYICSKHFVYFSLLISYEGTFESIYIYLASHIHIRKYFRMNIHRLV